MCQALRQGLGMQWLSWMASSRLSVPTLTPADTSPRLLHPRASGDPGGDGVKEDSAVGVSISTVHSLERLPSSL